MIKTYIIDKGQKPSAEQLEEVKQTAQREIILDEDAPELSEAMFKAFQCAVSQRNRKAIKQQV